jgi:hypothetical protein
MNAPDVNLGSLYAPPYRKSGFALYNGICGAPFLGVPITPFEQNKSISTCRVACQLVGFSRINTAEMGSTFGLGSLLKFSCVL